VRFVVIGAKPQAFRRPQPAILMRTKRLENTITGTELTDSCKSVPTRLAGTIV
jgi:hypothetical protein